MANKLTPGEAERIEYLAEEAAEVVKVCMKILRHGWIATDHSVEPPVEYNNRVDLTNELLDLRKAYERLKQAGVVIGDPLAPMRGFKANNRYFHHQGGNNA